MINTIPEKQGLYDSANEHDACGIGFIADIQGQQSHLIIQRGLQLLERMAHRGAEGADKETGDGAGILTQIPHRFFSKVIPNLPPRGQYGAGLVFFPKESEQLEYCQNLFHQDTEQQGQR